MSEFEGGGGLCLAHSICHDAEHHDHAAEQEGDQLEVRETHELGIKPRSEGSGHTSITAQSDLSFELMRRAVGGAFAFGLRLLYRWCKAGMRE